jgi:hypothetical protein
LLISFHFNKGTHSATSVTSGPTSRPPDIPTPPPSSSLMMQQLGNGMGTIRGNSSYYRTPVVPPSVPSEYLSRQELGIYSSKKELNQSLNATDSASYGAYPMVNGYRANSNHYNPHQSMSYLMNNSGVLHQNNQSVSEYSGTDTMDKRMANAFIQQQMSYPGGFQLFFYNFIVFA